MTDRNTSSTPSGKMDVFEGLDPEVKVRTKKMMMFFIMFAIVMLFAGFTSAQLVMYGGVYWIHVNPPTVLWMSLVFLALSSATMIVAVRAIRKAKKQMALAFTLLTFAGGIGFTITQVLGWNTLADYGMGTTVVLTSEGEEQTMWNTLEQISANYGEDYFIYKGTKENNVVLEGADYYFEDDADRTNPVTDDIRAQKNTPSSMMFVLLWVHVIHLVFGLIYLLVNAARISKGTIHSDDHVSLRVGGMYWHFMGILWAYLFAFLFVFH